MVNSSRSIFARTPHFLALRSARAALALLWLSGCGEGAVRTQDEQNARAEAANDDGDDDDGVVASEPSEPDESAAMAGKPDAGGRTLDSGQRSPSAVRNEAGDAAPRAQSDASAVATLDAAVDAVNRDEGPVSVAAKGPYKFKSYTAGLNESAYASSVMYYPEEISRTIGAIAFSPGFTATKESYTYLGELLASHGFAVLLTTPTSTADQPNQRGQDLQAAVARIQSENKREGSPLQGKLNGKVCITGHSMGGGGTLHAANALGDKIACAVPLQPWQPGASFAKVTAPTLFIGAQRDTIAGVSSSALTHYKSIPDQIEKMYAEMAGASHFYSTNQNRDHEVEAHFMVAWYKLHLHGDERYRAYLYGDKMRSEGVSLLQKSER